MSYRPKPRSREGETAARYGQFSLRAALAPAAELAVPAEPSFEEKKAIVLATPTLADVLAALMKAHPDAGAGDLTEEIYAFI